MFNTLIIDDEKPAREKLKRLLEELSDPEISLVGEAEDGLQAIEQIEALNPDLIILDVQMPGLNGFEVIRHLDRVPAVIFSTAFDRYAIDAFNVNAVDYLLKPYDLSRLRQAIEKMKQSVVSAGNTGTERIRTVVEQILAESKNFLERIPTKIGHRIRLLLVDQILWFDSQDSITFAHLDDGKDHDIRYTLDDLEKQLDPDTFFRTHRSSIVNLNFVEEIVPWFKGRFKVVLKDRERTEIELSRSRAQELRAVLKW